MTEPVVDMSKLQSEISQTAMPQDPERKRLFSSRERDAERQVSMGLRAPLASISEQIKRLTYDDAVKFGQAIAKHFTENADMASAVQRACDDLLSEGEQKQT